MKILVLNSGSSSIKYQLFDMTKELVLAKGVVERIGIDNSFLEYENYHGKKIKLDDDIANHSTGIKLVIKTILNKEYGVLEGMSEIHAIGHRIVHGGEKFADSTLIDEKVIEQIDKVSDLAPLHNPHNLTGVKVCKDLLPFTPQVAVFDTAFHQTMPKMAYMYALPYKYYEKYGIRRYGFHGTSHKYVSNRIAKLLNKPIKELKIITCHLGNGASIAAIDGGKSVDTSMGMTPLEGLVMGTRCGDIDPAIIPFLMNKEGISIHEMDDIMNKESGLYGISGISNDSRDIKKAADEGNEHARLALELFDYRVRKYIGAYMAAMGSVDAIVFTAGIGENAPEIRKNIIKGLNFLDIYLDEKLNKTRGKEIEISKKDSKVKVFVIPTNEELVIARETKDIVDKI
jgi:acetate kinase